MRGEKAKDEDIRLRLERVERLLEELASGRGETRIHIERLHVEHATLEQMTVRMDQLDVKEVSGSLNIGNNFHTARGEKLPQVPSPTSPTQAGTAASPSAHSDKPSGPVGKPEDGAKPQRSNLEGANGLRPTRSGYSYRYG